MSTSQPVDSAGLERLKRLAENDDGAWVDFHGDLWNLIGFYEANTPKREIVDPLEAEALKEEIENLVANILHHGKGPWTSAAEIKKALLKRFDIRRKA